MSWYREWFSDPDYLTLYHHRDELEAEQIINLIQSKLHPAPNSKIIDIGCGSGRHSIQLAKKGFRVTGFDLSEPLLQIAKTNAEMNNIEVNFIHGDMRKMDFTNEFDLALNLFTSFGYFESDEENEIVIQKIGRILKPEGTFIIDFLNREFLLRNLEPETTSEMNDIKIIQRRKIINNRVTKDIIIQKKGNETIFKEQVTLYSLDDFMLFFSKSGLTLTETLGDYAGSPFNYSSPRLILIGKRN